MQAIDDWQDNEAGNNQAYWSGDNTIRDAGADRETERQLAKASRIAKL